jgi:hypothetical protein
LLGVEPNPSRETSWLSIEGEGRLACIQLNSGASTTLFAARKLSKKPFRSGHAQEMNLAGVRSVRVSASRKAVADNQGSLLSTAVEHGFVMSAHRASMRSKSFSRIGEAFRPNVHLAQESCLYILYMYRGTEQVLFCQIVSLKRNASCGQFMCCMQCPVFWF